MDSLVVGAGKGSHILFWLCGVQFGDVEMLEVGEESLGVVEWGGGLEEGRFI